MLISSCMFVCMLQVPVTVDNVSVLPKTGGCLESTVNAMTESVTNMTALFAQVINTNRSYFSPNCSTSNNLQEMARYGSVPLI